MDKDNLKIILVEPLYQINLGYMARVLKNFGINEMNLVNPRCRYKGKEAVKYSKHAVDILKKAKVYRSISQATKGCDLVLGTTGIWYKSDKSFFNVYTPEDIVKFMKGKRRTALLVGRDDIGLTKEELKDCDANISVPANEQYPILNISHALAIILYELSRENAAGHPMRKFYADQKAEEAAIRLFSNLIKTRSNIRDKKAVLMAFRHVIKRSNATGKELNAIAVALSEKKSKHS